MLCIRMKWLVCFCLLKMEEPSIHRFFIINYMKIKHHGEACINTIIVEYSAQIAERLKEYIVGTVDQYSRFLFHYIPENESANEQYYDSLSGNYIKAFYAEFLSHTDFKAFCNGLELIKTITHSCSKYVWCVPKIPIVEIVLHYYENITASTCKVDLNAVAKSRIERTRGRGSESIDRLTAGTVRKSPEHAWVNAGEKFQKNRINWPVISNKKWASSKIQAEPHDKVHIFYKKSKNVNPRWW